jgi:hypothetical protein
MGNECWMSDGIFHDWQVPKGGGEVVLHHW